GVAPTAGEEELRRAHRLRLRETHPDTGGDAALFIRVQRAWERVGTPEARSAYDRGRETVSWVAPARPATARAAYDPATVRAAPWEVRRMLADALAEESTAAAIADLGIGFTAWHDVACGADAARKLDHVVLGPTGLHGLVSEDFGEPVRFRRGEVIGGAVGG